MDLIRIFYAETWAQVKLSSIRVVHQFEITPQAFANFSPRLERSDNPGLDHHNRHLNPERVRHWQTLSGFARPYLICFPRVVAALQPLG